MTRVAIGIDGCRYGWVSASRDGIYLAASLRDLFQHLDVMPHTHVIGIDMPIGLMDREKRRCDELAREKLLPKRHNSVFWTPTRRAVRESKDQAEASRINREQSMGGVSAQSFNLFKKIREIDDLLVADPDFRAMIFEVHPELSFGRWWADVNGYPPLSEPIPMPYRKKSSLGAYDRLTLIIAEYGRAHFEAARSAYAEQQVADDDIADAYAALYSAERIADNRHVTLPDEPPSDARGLPIRICY